MSSCAEALGCIGAKVGDMEFRDHWSITVILVLKHYILTYTKVWGLSRSLAGKKNPYVHFRGFCSASTSVVRCVLLGMVSRLGLLKPRGVHVSLSLYGQWLGYPSHCTITILTYTSKSRIVFCSGPLIGYDINNMYESLQHVRMVKIFLCGH